MITLEDIATLFGTIDSRAAFGERVNELLRWLESQPDVTAARLICRDRLILGPEDSSVPRISSSQASLLPMETAVLNGKSPIPHHIFPEDGNGPVAVYSPFTDRSGEFAGAILVKSAAPKLFLKRNESVLRVLASKTRDLVEIAGGRSSGTFPVQSRGTDDLTPQVIGKLMDLLSLPMYVLSVRGKFLSVNNRFLEQFGFTDLEEVNSRGEVFIREEEWGDELKRLTVESGFTPLTTKIRTGADRIRTFQDYSMLMGKTILGIVLDVSDFVRANEQLEDALEAQTFLNDKLSSATFMLQKTQATAMKSLAKLAEYRDSETGDHLQRICEFMKLISMEIHKDQPYSFHVSEDYVSDIYLSGMLHDIGKVKVPDQILLKPGPLDSAEWTVMKKHTSWGHSILDQADQELGEQSFLTLSSRIALHHHEWHNGDGYPHGLAGDDIPLSARIAAVADVYDALTSRRPYKEAWSHDHAVAEIQRLREKQFDPVISDIFMRLEDNFRSVSQRFSEEPAMVG
ncbi:MAG: HD domain-containing protein [Spirochaetales bacterium]|nr:MAG: HD domain-containing protein [Spirochaetales bacterium]